MEERNSQEGPVCFVKLDGKSQDVDAAFAPEGGNSGHDQVPFALVHLGLVLFGPVLLGRVLLAPEGGTSHNELVRCALQGGKPVECFWELELGLLRSLRDPTGLGHWEVVTNRSA